MRIFDWFDNIEVAVFAIVAGLLLVVGPLFITYRFALAHHEGVALGTGALWLCCVVACIRDFTRQRLSWVSGGVLAVWVLTTLVLGFVVA